MKRRRGIQIGRQIDRVRVVAEALAQRPGQVVVPIDQRRSFQDSPCPRLAVLGGRGQGQGKHGAGEQEGADHDGLVWE